MPALRQARRLRRAWPACPRWAPRLIPAPPASPRRPAAHRPRPPGSAAAATTSRACPTPRRRASSAPARHRVACRAMIPPIPVSPAGSATKDIETKRAINSPPVLFLEPVASPEVGPANDAGPHGSTASGAKAMTILKWALIFLVVSIIAGLLGFTGVSIVSADIARFLFYAFAVIFLGLLILGLTIFRA